MNESKDKRSCRIRYGWLIFYGAVLALLASIILPAFRPWPWERRPADHLQCLSNLRQIGSGLLMYAQEHRRRMPDSLDVLITEFRYSPRAFVCPVGGDLPAQGPTTQALLADFAKPGRCSYVYVGKGMVKPSARMVLAYEVANNHKSGAGVLFADGSVRWLNQADMTKLLADLNAGRNPPPSLAPATRPRKPGKAVRTP